MQSKIIVLGGDGFCGWPTALHLSDLGYDIVIVDSLVRRSIEKELGAESLTPIVSMQERIAAWRAVSGRTIEFCEMDVAQDYDALFELILNHEPMCIIHFAEQRAAPYSMKSSQHKRYTVTNNISATHNLLSAIVESGQGIHLVHLGTMGIYGYGVIPNETPEGYLEVSLPKEDGSFQLEIPYPASPGSVYHVTKEMDASLFRFYNRNDNLRITDLHQGIVWGVHTKQTIQHEHLINRFDYDGDFGTVLNRFLVQAALQHPLTVYGNGGQARAFINIQNTVECIGLAVSNPPSNGMRVQVLNQMTEVYTVSELASMVSKLSGAEITHIENPRVEKSENSLLVSNNTLLGLGMQPKLLSELLMEEIVEIADQFKDRVRPETIYPTSFWRSKK